jgi:hypothetical protein
LYIQAVNYILIQVIIFYNNMRGQVLGEEDKIFQKKNL